jgi:hypothetical protein
MRLRDGRYECTLCGAILDVPEELTTTMEAAELSGDEIHRCEFRRHPVALGARHLLVVGGGVACLLALFLVEWL